MPKSRIVKLSDMTPEQRRLIDALRRAAASTEPARVLPKAA